MDSFYDMGDVKLTPNVTARQKREYWRASLQDKSRQESALIMDNEKPKHSGSNILYEKHPTAMMATSLQTERDKRPTMRSYSASFWTTTVGTVSTKTSPIIPLSRPSKSVINSSGCLMNPSAEKKTQRFEIVKVKEYSERDHDIPKSKSAINFNSPTTESLAECQQRKPGYVSTDSIHQSPSTEYSVRKQEEFDSLKKNSITNSPANIANETMNNQRIENEFQNLSLIFRTDASTIKERSRLLKHQHKIADKDLYVELSELKSQINNLKSLIIDSSFTNGPKIFSSLTKLQQQTDIIEDGIHRLSLKSELSGSVSYELKMMNAFSIAQLHVDNLKRAKERDERELEDIKRLLCLPNEQNCSNSHEKTSTFWLNQEKPMDQFEENILKLATSSATPITAAAASKINFIRLRRASVASMDYQSKEITRRSRVFKPELKILRQSDNTVKPEALKTDESTTDDRNQDRKTDGESVKTKTNLNVYGNNFKEMCKKYRDKLTETWIEEEQPNDEQSNCCETLEQEYSPRSSSPSTLGVSSLRTAENPCRKIETNKEEEFSFTQVLYWIVKNVYNFLCEKNRFYIVELMKFAENIDAINSQEDFVQLRYLIAAFLLFVSFMLFLWNILLPFMV